MDDLEFQRWLRKAHYGMMTDEEMMDEKIHYEACNVFDNEIGAYGRNISIEEFFELTKEEQDAMIIPQIRDCCITEEHIEKVRDKLKELFL